MLSNFGAREDLRVPWTARRSNQSILKEIHPEYSLEGLRLKLKLQYFGHLIWRSQLIGKDSDSGKGWRKKKRRQQMRWLDGIIYIENMSLSNLWEAVKDSQAWYAAVHRVTTSLTWQWLNSKLCRASLIAQLVKNLPAIQETPVRFLGRKHPAEKG